MCELKGTKSNIFFERRYCRILLLRHNISTLHMETNIYDNLPKMILDIPGKTMDIDKVRKD